MNIVLCYIIQTIQTNKTKQKTELHTQTNKQNLTGIKNRQKENRKQTESNNGLIWTYEKSKHTNEVQSNKKQTKQTKFKQKKQTNKTETNKKQTNENQTNKTKANKLSSN